MKIVVKSTSQARVVESFRTAASQARRAAADLAAFSANVVATMSRGIPPTTDGLPSAAETYVRADAQVKVLWSLLPKDLTADEVTELMSGEYVAIEVAEKVN